MALSERELAKRHRGATPATNEDTYVRSYGLSYVVNGLATQIIVGGGQLIITTLLHHLDTNRISTKVNVFQILKPVCQKFRNTLVLDDDLLI